MVRAEAMLRQPEAGYCASLHILKTPFTTASLKSLSQFFVHVLFASGCLSIFLGGIAYAREHFLFTLLKKHFGSHSTAKSFSPLTPKLFARTQSGRVIFISAEQVK